MLVMRNVLVKAMSRCIGVIRCVFLITLQLKSHSNLGIPVQDVFPNEKTITFLFKLFFVGAVKCNIRRKDLFVRIFQSFKIHLTFTPFRYAEI